MRRRWRDPALCGIAGLILLVCLFAASYRLAVAQDQASAGVAGVVVDYGDGQVSYALVPFTGDTISGMDLLHQTGLPLLTVDFGGMGEGVCKIDVTGCDPSPCRARLCQTGDPDSPFWQYLRDDPEGEWEFVQLGASATTVRDGDVNGWYWTGTTPDGAALSLDDIAGHLDVNLDDLRADASLEPVVATIGEEGAGDASPDRQDVLVGAGIVVTLAVAGVVAIRRTRVRAQP